MTAREIKTGIYSVGSIDWDRKLFDELIPLPDGTSYNAYLVKGGEKVVLVDTVYPPKAHELEANLSELGVEKIDYIISNHAEADHSGAIPRMLELYPEAKIVTNQKCKEFLKDLLLIQEDKFMTVNDGDKLSLGNKTLEFIFAPWVHWPETMLTYLREDKILFTCDLFGSHLATTELFAKDEAKVYEAAKRYYAEIMMPFRTIIKKHMKKIGELGAETIAPSHGPVYDKPEFILDAYEKWVSDEVMNEVVIPYVSMYGSTEKMVNHLSEALVKKGITVKVFNLTKTDIGQLAMSFVDAATIVIASPTVLTGPHPNIAYAAHLVNALRPKLKFGSIIGSYGWGGRMVEQIKGTLTNLKLEFIEPVIAKGYPKEEDMQKLDELADEIFKRHRDLGLVAGDK